jgi:5-bromo-4-chloroindolyl phosphate hydrolysis protein
MKVILILSILAGIALAYSMKVFFKISLLLAVPAGIVLFVVLRGVLRKLILKRNQTMTSITPKEEQAREVSRDGIKRMKKLKSQTIKIRDNRVARQVQEICRIGLEIFNHLRENPNDLNRARQFTSYYIDVTEKIVNRYIDLSKHRDTHENIDESLHEVEESLETLRGTYEKQLAHLYEDDVLDLNAEITLLKRIMKLEG